MPRSQPRCKTPQKIRSPPKRIRSKPRSTPKKPPVRRKPKPTPKPKPKPEPQTANVSKCETGPVMVIRRNTTIIEPEYYEPSATNPLDATTKASSSVTFVYELPEAEAQNTASSQVVYTGEITTDTSSTSASLTDGSQHSRQCCRADGAVKETVPIIKQKKPRRRFKISMKRFRKKKDK